MECSHNNIEELVNKICFVFQLILMALNSVKSDVDALADGL